MSEDAVDYPAQVRGHVWESLVSMLRVYAHAASLNGQEYLVTSTGNEVGVKHENATLSLSFRPDTGEGVWRVTHPEREEMGEFRIQQDGALTCPASPKPLDTAAMDWIELLVHGTTPSSNEHLPHPLGIS